MINRRIKEFCVSESEKMPQIVRKLFLWIFIAANVACVSASAADTDSDAAEKLRYHGMGNLLSSGFMTYEDGRCNYISLNTLTAVDDTTETRPFRVMLPEAPKAYWLDKNVMNCVLSDSIFIRVESRGTKAEEKIGLQNIEVDDVWSMLNDFNVDYNDYLDNLNPEIYSWFYKVVYDYYNGVTNIQECILAYEEESRNYRNVNFTITYPDAKFYFINVPAQRITECMHLAGSFERIERCEFQKGKSN